MKQYDENIEELNAYYSELISIFARVTDEDEVRKVFDAIFTPAEKMDFSERWLTVRKMNDGITQREIALKYHLSLCKITRGSKELHKEDSTFLKMIKMVDPDK